jgi:hypothetical protein
MMLNFKGRGEKAGSLAGTKSDTVRDFSGKFVII